jgi:hypothetical protein
MHKSLKKYAFVPDRLVTDDLRSYASDHEGMVGCCIGFDPRRNSTLRTGYIDRANEAQMVENGLKAPFADLVR